MSPNLVRWAGLGAMLGALLGVALTPVLSYLWAAESELYGWFGRAYFPVFVGCLAGLAGLYARRMAGTGPRGADELDEEGWIFVATFIGLAVSLVGDVLEYWGGSPGEGFTAVQVKGFGVEVMGLVLVLFGSVALGVTYRRADVLPGYAAWLLIAAGPAGVLLSIVHIPSGTMLVFCCAWAVVGYLLLMGRVDPAGQGSHTG